MSDASAAAAEAKPPVFVPPPKIEELFAQASGQMATVNRPVAGAKREEELPEGSAPIQLYSAGTPNGAKVRAVQGRGQGVTIPKESRSSVFVRRHVTTKSNPVACAAWAAQGFVSSSASRAALPGGHNGCVQHLCRRLLSLQCKREAVPQVGKKKRGQQVTHRLRHAEHCKAA